MLKISWVQKTRNEEVIGGMERDPEVLIIVKLENRQSNRARKEKNFMA